MDLNTITNIIMWLIGGIAACFVFALSFAFAVKERISILTEKQRNCEFVIEHLTKSGENIKSQIQSHDMILERMQADMKHIVKGIDEINAKISNLN